MRLTLVLIIILLCIKPSYADNPPESTLLCEIDTESSIEDDLKVYDLPLKERQNKSIEPVGYLTEGDLFTCLEDKKDKTEGGEIILPTSSGKKLFVFLPSSRQNKIPHIKRLGTSPKRIYLDGTPKRTVQINSKIINNSDQIKNTEVDASPPPENNDGTSAFTVGDNSNAYFVRDTKFVDDYFDPIQKKIVPRSFYKVDVVPNNKKSIAKYKKGKLKPTKSGWIDSLVTRSDELKYTPDTAIDAGEDADRNTYPESPKEDEYCPKSEPLDFLKDQVKTMHKEVSELAKEVAPTPLTGSAKSAAEIVKGNSCFTNENQVKSNIRAPLNPAATFEKMAKTRYSGENKLELTPSLLAAIDMYARTIYGEMRSCHNSLGARYSKAQARILLNRAELCQKRNRCEFGSRNVNGAPLSEAVIAVVSKNKHFSAWNADDNNLDDILCIAKTKIDTKIWNEAVDIAASALLQTENFAATTESVGANTFHYVSAYGKFKTGDPSWAGNMSRVDGIRIDGLPVDKQICIRPYSTRVVVKLLPQNLFFIEQNTTQNLYALSVCTVRNSAIW